MGKRTFGIALFFALLFSFAFPKPVQAATCTWTGSSGNWSSTANWQNCNNGVPGNNDSAVIDTAVTVTQDVNIDTLTLTISNGTLLTSSSYTTKFETLNLQGGAISGTGGISVGTLFQWTAGTLSTSGTTTVDTALTLSGTLTLSNGTLNMNKSGSGADTTTWTGAGTLSGNGTFDNEGDLIKSSTGLSKISGVTFINTGAISVTEGILDIVLSGTTSHGPYSVSSGKTLIFSGPHDFKDNDNENISGAGTVEFKSGAININNTKSGAFALTGGVIISGAAVDFKALSPSLTSLVLSSGSLAGTGTVAAGTVTWSGGTMSGSGNTTASASLDLSGALTLTGRTLTSSTAATWSGTGGSLGGTGTFSNSGTLTKATSDTTSFTVSSFSNSGAVSVTGGVLEFSLTTGSTGTYAVSNPATLRFLNGHTFGASSSISGTGTVEFQAGTTTVNGPYNVTGTTLISGAAVTISPINLTSLGSTLTITSGSMDIGNKSTAVSTFNLGSAGTFTGTGTLTTGILNWSGGTQNGTGGTTAVTTTLDLSGSLTLTGRTLSSSSAAVWSAGGTLSGTGTFTNMGSLTKTSPDTSTISVTAFNQNGTVSCSNGILELSPSDASTGSYAVSGTCKLIFTSGHTFEATETITGTGTFETVEFSSGTVAIQSDYNVSGATRISGANVSMIPANLLSLGLSLSLTGGSLDIGDKNMTFNSFYIGPGTTFSGSGTITIPLLNWHGGTITGGGTATVSSSLGLSGNTILSGYTLNTNAPVTWADAGSVTGTGTWNNTGAISKSGIYLSSVDLQNAGTVKFNNTGAISVSQGTLEINISGTSHGPYTLVTGSSTLRFTGSHVFADTANEVISGTGTVEFQAGTINLLGSYGGFAKTIVSGAAVTVSKPAASTGPFEVSAGSLRFAGSHTFFGLDTITATGTGMVEFSAGTIAIQAAYNVSSTTTISGATVTIDPVVLTNLGATLTLTAGSLDLGSASPSVTTFQLGPNGSLAGTGTLTAGSMTWSGGSMSGGGVTAVNGALDLSGTLTLNRTLTLASGNTATWGAAGSLTGTGTWTNSGSLAKNSPDVSSISLITLNQSGAVNVSQGTLSLQLSAASTGTYQTTSPGLLQFTGSHSFLAGANFSGDGSVEFVTGPFTVQSSYAISGETRVSGALTIQYAAAATSTGGFNLLSGGVTFSGDHTFGTGAAFSGSGSVTFGSGIITVNSSYSIAGTTTVVSGTLNLNTTADPAGPFVVNGVLNLTGDRTFGDAAPISGIGTVEFKSGSLHIQGAYNLDSSNGYTWVSGATVDMTDADLTSLGRYLVLSGGTLDLGGQNTGIENLAQSGTSTLTGTGILTVIDVSWSGGSMTGTGRTEVTGALNFSGTLSMTDRTVQINATGFGVWPVVGSLSGTGSVINLGTFSKTIGGVAAISGITFQNSGLVQVTGGQLDLPLTSDSLGSYWVSSPGVLRIMNSVNLASSVSMTGSGTIDFNGAGATVIQGAYGFSGLTFVHNGTVALQGESANSGPFTVESGTLRFLNNRTFPVGANLQGAGTIEFGAGTITINSLYTLDAAGTTLVSGAAVSLANPGAAPVFGSALTLSSGSLNLATGHTATVGTLTISGGMLTGTDGLNATHLNWSGGSMAGSGTTAVSNGLTMSGNLSLAETRTLAYTKTNNNAANWSGTSTLSGAGTFSNTGKLIKNEASLATISVAHWVHSGTLEVSDGTLAIQPATTLPITHTGDYTVTSPGTIRFSGSNGCSHTFSAGTLGGTGTLEFETCAFSVQTGYTLSGTTRVSGTLTIHYPSSDSSTGSFNVQSGGVTFTGSHTFGSGATFSGSGNVTFAGGTFAVNGSYAIGGTTTISSGTVNFATTATQTGPFIVNGTLNLSQDKSFGAAAPISGTGTVDFQSGSITILGSYNLDSASGSTLVSGGTADMKDATLTSLGGTLNISSGTLDLGSKDASAGTLTISGSGILTGTGTLTVLTSFTWTGGSMTSTGTTAISGTWSCSGNVNLNDRTLQINGTGVATCTGNGSFSGTGSVINQGTFTKTGNGTITFTGVSFQNSSTGQVQVDGGQLDLPLTSDSQGSYISTNPGTLRFMNAVNFGAAVTMTGNGTMDFYAAGATELQGAYNVTGLTLVHNGVLSLHAASATSGPFTVESGTLRFLNNRIFPVGANLQGAGTIEFNAGTITVNSLYALDAAGTTLISGAAVSLTNPDAAPEFGASLTLSSGSLNLATGKTAQVGTFTLSGGTLTGPDSITATHLSWSGGSMSGSGTTTVDTGLTMSGALSLNGPRTLAYTNASNTDANWSGASTLSGTGTFANTGKLVKNGTSLATISLSNWSHSGTVNVSDGTLVIQSPVPTTHFGDYSVASPGVLRFTGPNLLSFWSDFTGGGTVEFGPGTSSVQSNYGLTGETRVNGTLTIQYPSSATSTGSFNVQSGGVTFYGNHIFGTGATFSGPGTVALGAGTIDITDSYAVSGTTTISSGTVNLTMSTSQTGTFVANGTLNILNPSGNRVFEATSLIGGSGVVDFQSGNIQFLGTIDRHAMFGTTQVSGATLDLSSATITNLGSTLFVTSGTLDFGTQNASVTAFFLSGSGNLTGTGTLTVLNCGWSGGTMTGDGNNGTTIVNQALSLSGDLTLSGRTLQINGTTNATWSGAGSLSGSGSVINQGTFSKTGDGTLTFSGVTFHNTGQVRVEGGQFDLPLTANSQGSYVVISPGILRMMNAVNFGPAVSMTGNGSIDFDAAGATVIQGAYSVTGLTLVHNGTVSLQGASATSGAFTVASGSLRFLNNRTFPVGANLQGAGTIEFGAGTIIINSLYTLDAAGTTLVSGAVVSLTNPGAAPAFGSALTLSSGSLNLATTHAATVGTLTISGGALTGTDSVDATNLNWTGGSMAGSGTTTVATGLTMNGNLSLNGTRTLSFTNAANAAANWTGATTITGTGSFANSGKLIKNETSLTTLSMAQWVHSGAVEVTDGTLVIQPAASLPTPHTGSYTVTSPGMIRFTGSHTFSSGTLGGSGNLEFETGVFSVQTGYTLSGTTRVNGAVSIQYPSSGLHSTGPFNVTAGTLTFSGGHVFDPGADFTGAGVVEFTSGAYTIDSSYGLSGETRVLDQVAINYPASATSTGSFTITQPGALTFSGGHTFDTGTVFGGTGTVEFASGAFTVNGRYLLSGDTRVTSSLQLNFPAPAETSTGKMIVNGTLEISGSHTFEGGLPGSPSADFTGTGSVEFKSGAVSFTQGCLYQVSGTMTISGANASVSLSGATLTSLGSTLNLQTGSLYLGAQNVEVATFNWSGGTLYGSGGTTTVPVGGQLKFLGTDSLVLSAQELVNLGTATWNRSSEDGYLFLANGAAFTNGASATFDLQNSGAFVFNGTGAFINEGIFNKTNTDAAVIAGISFQNNGSGGSKGVNVTGGSLEIGSFTPQDSSSSGSYQVSGGTTLIFSGSSSHVFSGTATFDGTGKIEFRSGSITLNGTVAYSGELLISGANVLMSSLSTPTNLGSTLTLSAGSLELSSGKAVTMSHLDLSGGELKGGDTVTISTQLDWSAGGMSGSGITQVDGTADFSGNQTLTLSQRSLVIQGSAQWNSSAYLYLTQGAVLEIGPSATFIVNPTSSFVFYGTGECRNAGTLTLKGGIINLSQFTQTATGITEIIFKGSTPGADYGQVQAGSLQLAGELRVSGAPGFVPAQSLITLMTYINQPAGAFNKITLSAPFESWETKILVDRFNLSTPALKTFIPMLSRQP